MKLNFIWAELNSHAICPIAGRRQMFDDPETSNTYPQVDQADYDARWRKTFSKWSLADVAVICS